MSRYHVNYHKDKVNIMRNSYIPFHYYCCTRVCCTWCIRGIEFQR